MKLNIQLFAYTKKEWKDLPSKDTPILAADLNNIENGIETNDAMSTKNSESIKTNIANANIEFNKLKAENEYLNSVIEQAFTPVEKEGTSINYDNTINARFKDIKLCGDTTQNGTPTPDTPVPVNVVSGDNSIVVCGKNLFNKYGNLNEGGGRPNTISLNSQEQLVSTANFNEWRGRGQQINNLTANTNYTISGVLISATGTADIQAVIQILTTTNSTISTLSIFKKETKPYQFSHTFNTGENTSILISFSGKDDNVSIKPTTTFDNIQLEKGSTATTYEPYIGNSYPISLGDIELCKIGDYRDRIYQDNNKWYLEKQIGKVVLNGSEDWQQSGAYTNNTIYSVYSRVTNYNYGQVISDLFIWNKNISPSTITEYITTGGGILRIGVLKSRLSAYTINEFKTWLSNNNVTAYYVLATPTITEITDNTLLEQLEELAGATTYAGETNIVATSDGLTIIPKTTALTK